jgi:ATP-dependent protease HslVU (ClpYQ) ATPase subunit
MESASLAFNSEIDSLTTQLSQADRDSQSADPECPKALNARARASDLRGELTALRDRQKFTEQDSKVQEEKEANEKLRKEESDKLNQENAQQESAKKLADHDLLFLDDPTEAHKPNIASAAVSASSTASTQFAGKTNTYESTDEKTTAKPVSSSGQAST